ncbi:hypothetical protein VCUG_00859 [Vavraia culicis subsp. floridensis]|uniref:Uncharacterized protein n=1 Tax=Vavraia culicis (isolate floridensis) TaxID=948595 RepID=L2GWI0_VAVCU|nr:uncharacterized protein VCUG_00859 [Vavraia culicis subsp. floridensis]ELA47658.1 hypothetical protein VCUG_00859 [Vavraia culicis subsp. floridensis]
MCTLQLFISIWYGNVILNTWLLSCIYCPFICSTPFLFDFELRTIPMVNILAAVQVRKDWPAAPLTDSDIRMDDAHKFVRMQIKNYGKSIRNVNMVPEKLSLVLTRMNTSIGLVYDCLRINRCSTKDKPWRPFYFVI